MPIYEFRCEECGRVSEFLLMGKDREAVPRCKRCNSRKMSRILSRVRVVRSEESRLEGLSDPSKWGDLDENDPKSMARWMKRMGKEMGEESGEDIDQMVDEALEEEASPKSGGSPED